MPLLLRWSVAFRAARADQEHLNEVDGGEMTCGESILELSERRFLQVGEVWVGHLAQKKKKQSDLRCREARGGRESCSRQSLLFL